MKNEICWQWKCFDELSLVELHAIFVLRAHVFVVEQNCVYQDPDTDDLHSLHLLAKNGERLVAYSRIIPPHTCDNPKIGRVVVAKDYRQCGLGKKAIVRGVERCEKDFPTGKVCVSAQAYLMPFYKSLGFIAISDIYDEDGIDHVDMVYVKSK